jgi:DNA-binding CsgD family transcriptional regulator
MDEKSGIFKAVNVQNIPALKDHLLHILDTTQLLLNLENCTLSLTNEDGSGSLDVESSVEAASIAFGLSGSPRNPQTLSENAIQHRQRLELKLGELAIAARAHLTQSAVLVEGHTDGISNSSGPFIEIHMVRQAPFGRLSDREKNAVQRVLELINGAIATYLDERTDDYYASILDRLLAHLCIGLIRLDSNLLIVEKSSLVDTLLETTGSYRCESNRLVDVDHPHDDTIARAIQSLRVDEVPYAIADVVSTAHQGQCAIVVTDLAAGSRAGGYLVYLLCSIADHFEASDLLNFWHITPAEKRALAALTRFGNIKKVAIELGVSPNTVKTQLKSAYKKLGVDNKISLLRRFSLLRLIDALMTHRT